MKRVNVQRTHHSWLYKGMKVVSVPVLVFLVLCLATPLIVLTSFYLSFSVSKHHNLLLSTYEFIVVAKSNRVAVFFMFNVIIITIVLGSFRPYSKLEDLEWYEVKKDAIEKEAFIYCDYYCSDCEDGNDYGSDGYDEDNDDDGSEDDINSEEFYGEENDNGDLERRTEDFIAKVTRKWREELVHEKLMYLAAAARDSSQSSSSM